MLASFTVTSAAASEHSSEASDEDPDAEHPDQADEGSDSEKKAIDLDDPSYRFSKVCRKTKKSHPVSSALITMVSLIQRNIPRMTPGRNSNRSLHWWITVLILYNLVPLGSFDKREGIRTRSEACWSSFSSSSPSGGRF